MRKKGILGLSVPDSLDTLGEADVVCLKLVEANTSKNSGGVQPPHEALAGLGDTLAGKIVDNARLEADVRVDENGRDEDGVHDGVEGTRGKGSNGQRDQAGRNEALEAPVVATVGSGRVGDGGGVVDCGLC